MFRVKKLTDYAVMLLVELGAAFDADPGSLRSAQTLAEDCGLEVPTVSKVLKVLMQQGLVGSCRGPAGGYRLLQPLRDISVADVICAMEGPIAMTECSVHAGRCSVESNCRARGQWHRISEAVLAALSGISLAEMRPQPAAVQDRSLPLATVNA